MFENALYAVMPVASVPQTLEPEASVSSADEHEAMVGILMPPVNAVIPANVDVADAESADAEIPPVKVEVAVVVETIEPTVTCELVAAIDVPLNQRRPEESCVALVPPDAMPRALARFSELIHAVVALKSVDVALSNKTVEDALSPASLSVVVVAETPAAGWVHASYVVIPESVPQITSPAAFVSSESQDVSVETLSPPVCICRPLRVEVAEAKMLPVRTPPANVEVAVEVASMVSVSMRRTWRPLLSDVDVAVDVPISNRSINAVDEAINEYGTLPSPVSASAVEVADTD